MQTTRVDDVPWSMAAIARLDVDDDDDDDDDVVDALMKIRRWRMRVKQRRMHLSAQNRTHRSSLRRRKKKKKKKKLFIDFLVFFFSCFSVSRLFGNEPQQLVAIADDGRLKCVPDTMNMIKQIGNNEKQSKLIPSDLIFNDCLCVV
jgi:hypothetical protein